MRVEHKNDNDKFVITAKTKHGYDLTTVTIEEVAGEEGKPETNTIKVTVNNPRLESVQVGSTESTDTIDPTL